MNNRQVPRIRFFSFAALLLFVLFSLSSLLSACGGTAGDQGEKIKVATTLNKSEVFLYLTDFKRHHPDIKPEIEFMKENEILDALRRPEKDRPDLLWGVSAVTLSQARDQGLLTPYACQRLEHLDPRFYDSGRKVPSWIGMRAYASAFAVSNYEQYKEGFRSPRSHEDLLDPAFRNNIIAVDPETSAKGLSFVSHILRSMGEEKGWKYLEELDKNVRKYVPSSTIPPRLAGRSGCMVGLSILNRCLAEQKKGAPISVHAPVDGPAWGIEANAIVKKKEDRKEKEDAVRNFMDWTFSGTMMKMYSRSYPAVSDREIDREIGDSAWGRRLTLPENDIEWTAQHKSAILKEWKKRFGAKTSSAAGSADRGHGEEAARQTQFHQR